MPNETNDAMSDGPEQAAGAPVVTVVLPVLNSSQHLLACLKAVAAQTMINKARVLVIDGGSQDDTVTLAEQFAETRPQFEVYAHHQGGAGGARNAAMRVAATPYIVFWDSTDTPPPTALANLHQAISESGAQVAVGRAESFPHPAQWAWDRAFDGGSQVVRGLGEVPDLIHSATCWNKMFHLEFLRSYQIAFAEAVQFSDPYVALAALLLAERIALVDEIVYQRRSRMTTTQADAQGMWQEQAAYNDHLAQLDYFAARHPYLTMYQQEALERYMIRVTQPFLVGAPEVFAGPAARQFFDRCRAVFQGMSPDQLVRHSNGPRHRIAYLALLQGDFELFMRPGDALVGVHAYDGELHADYPAPSWALPLTRTGKATARVESLDVTDGEHDNALVVRGRIDVDGVPGKTLTGTWLRLTVGEKYTAHTEVEAGQETAGAFAVTLPAPELPERGSSTFTLTVITPGGSVEAPCEIGNEARQAQPVMAGQLTARLTADEGAAVLVIEPAV
ncbi:glycosyltransferase family 2 protein [Streptomyces fractus]|uniref:glycosyltransferase family 2 protein n=1 Tax=Streptomyces fractus TaxID=641806 RepID=UPI003CEAB591